MSYSWTELVVVAADPCANIMHNKTTCMIFFRPLIIWKKNKEKRITHVAILKWCCLFPLLFWSCACLVVSRVRVKQKLCFISVFQCSLFACCHITYCLLYKQRKWVFFHVCSGVFRRRLENTWQARARDQNNFRLVTKLDNASRCQVLFTAKLALFDTFWPRSEPTLQNG